MLIQNFDVVSYLVGVAFVAILSFCFYLWFLAELEHKEDQMSTCVKHTVIRVTSKGVAYKTTTIIVVNK